MTHLPRRAKLSESTDLNKRSVQSASDRSAIRSSNLATWSQKRAGPTACQAGRDRRPLQSLDVDKRGDCPARADPGLRMIQWTKFPFSPTVEEFDFSRQWAIEGAPRLVSRAVTRHPKAEVDCLRSLADGEELRGEGNRLARDPGPIRCPARDGRLSPRRVPTASRGSAE